MMTRLVVACTVPSSFISETEHTLFLLEITFLIPCHED